MAGGDGGFAVDIAGGGFVLDFADVVRTVLRVGFLGEEPKLRKLYVFTRFAIKREKPAGEASFCVW